MRLTRAHGHEPARIVAARGSWGLTDAQLDSAPFLGDAVPGLARSLEAKGVLSAKFVRGLGLLRWPALTGLARALEATGVLSAKFVRGAGSAPNAWQVLLALNASSGGSVSVAFAQSASSSDEDDICHDNIAAGVAEVTWGNLLLAVAESVDASATPVKCSGVAEVTWGNLLLAVAGSVDESATPVKCSGSQVEVLSRKAFLSRFPPGGGPPSVRGAGARGLCGGARAAPCASCFLKVDGGGVSGEVGASVGALGRAGLEWLAPGGEEGAECERAEPSVVRAQQGGGGGGTAESLKNLKNLTAWQHVDRS
ncbi:hypothetical protein T484DRAFT_1893319 [Baffinella frigidus]|nr:hypothetical protein T484DRAFT_1893319 [Cryptophyta sp. CCMP2293]